MALSKIEKQYLARKEAEYKLFTDYKLYLAKVKEIYLKSGTFAAQAYVKKNALFIIELAVDDLLADILPTLDES
ncbi:MAG: hypothetical protein IMZ64_00490 [Bacteroidetes bacterium]|nr:hypothetical protein [Bacteroidota bacterium]